MALADKTLSQLARLRAGIGPVRTVQATIVAPNAAPANNEDGVDVSNAALAVVKVLPTGGDPLFNVWARTEGDDDEWETLNHLTQRTTHGERPWKEVLFCGPEAELYIEVEDMGGASSVLLVIEPCNG